MNNPMSKYLAILALLAATSANAAGFSIGGRAYPSLQAALDAAKPGDKVEVAPGEYHEAGIARSSRLTLAFSPAAKFSGVAAEGKAMLVIKGNDTTVTGLDCSEIGVASGNGACIRLEGRNLSLDRVHFHDSEQGILGGGDGGQILISDSVFERLGAGGSAHGIYVSADRVLIRNSRILASQGEGHEVKTRARETIIESSVIASLGGVDSRLIDISNGGILKVTGSVLQKGPVSSNGDLIGFGLEGLRYPDNRIEISGNVLILEREGPNRILHTKSEVTTRFEGNLIVGSPADSVPAGNALKRNRASAGLPPAPNLPPPGKYP